MPISIEDTYREFALNWYNNVIQLHYVDQERLVPIVEYRDDLITSRNIGFIKLYTSTATHVTQWLIHSKLFSHSQIKRIGVFNDNYHCRFPKKNSNFYLIFWTIENYSRYCNWNYVV